MHLTSSSGLATFGRFVHGRTSFSNKLYNICLMSIAIAQSQPGVFHLLPLAQRVQNKLEGLIDHYMSELGKDNPAQNYKSHNHVAN